MSALTTLQKIFPQVEQVKDSNTTILVSVTSEDSSKARKKDPKNCALARACVRQKLADAAIIGIGYSYLINGNKAIRYKTSNGVAREIVSFDRHQDFEEGNNYLLSKVSPSGRLNRHKGSGGPHKIKRDTSKTKVHRTANIRVIRKYV